MPGRPSASGFTTAAAAGVDTISWTHTAVAGDAIYVVIQSDANILGSTTFPTVTFGGVPLLPRAALYHLNFFAYVSWVFALPAVSVVAGPATLAFTNSAVFRTYVGSAINVANAPAAASVVLPGIFSQDSWPTIDYFTKSAYAWDALGLQIAVGFSFGLGTVLVLSGGTTLGTGTSVAMQSAPSNDDLIPFTLQSSHVGTHGLQLLSFMIPPDETEQPRTGGGFYPWFTYPTDLNFGVGGFALPGLPWGDTPTNGRACGIQLVAGTAHSWVVTTNQPVGVGNTVVAEIMRGGLAESSAGYQPVPTGITLTITGGVQTQDSRADLAALLSWAKYEQLYVKYTFTAGTSLPVGTTIRSSFLVESGEDAAQVYGGGLLTFGGSGVIDVPFYKAPLHPRDAAWGGTANSDKSLIGPNVTQTEMVAQRQTSTAVAVDAQFYMEKRLMASPLVGVLQDGSGGTVDTTATYPTGTLLPGALARSRFSLPWSTGDLISHVGFRRIGSTLSRHAVVSKVVAQTRGESLLSGHSVVTSGASNYSARPNVPQGPTVTTAQEATTPIIIPPMTAAGDDYHIRGIIAYLELTGPGDTRSLTQRLRQNLANTTMPDLVLTGSPAAPLYGDVGGDVAYTDLDQISQLFLVSNTPVLQRQFWAYVGFSAPPVGQIVVIKDAGGDLSTLFDFLAGGGLTPTAFQLVGGGVQVFADLTPGSGYSILETPLPSGWQLVSVTVSNGSDPTNISVGAGETVTLTFLNDTCPGERGDPRTDGLPYTPTLPGGLVTFNGEIVTFNGEPVTFGECVGSGRRTQPRRGA